MPSLTNEQILARLDQAFKTITVGDLDDAILTPEKFDQFVRVMQHRTAILNEARFIAMEAQQTDIDRVGFVGRILVAGEKLVNSEREHHVLEEDDYVKPQFHTNKLIAKELQAVCGIRDKALRRNIERGNFEDTLVDLFGEAAGRDLEEWALMGNTDLTGGDDDDIISLSDNWIKLAEQKVFGDGASPDFDPTDEDFPENMFQAMLEALPKQYLQNRSEWRYYVPFEVEDAYRNLLKARGTALGDQAQQGDTPFRYKGIPIMYVPMLERSKDPNGDQGVGRVSLLSHPDNMAWGIFHEVTVEQQRHAISRRTDFVLTVEADAHYEDENAAVAAYLDMEE